MTVSRRDPHLGELAAALVDGALDHGARDRALIHVTRCDDCRLEVDAQRRLKAQLRSMFAPPAPAGLADRLRALPDRIPVPDPVELPPDRFGARFRTDARPRSYGRAPDATPATTRTLTTISGESSAGAPTGQRLAGRRADDRPAGQTVAGVRGPGRRPSRRRRYAATAAGGLAAFALALGAVAAAGDTPRLDPVVPQVSTFILQHAGVTGGVPGPDAEVGVIDVAHTGR